MINTKVKISVIVPIRNSERSLDACISSLTNQTHSELEIILVDNGSVDDSLLIMKKYAKSDARIKIAKEKKVGVSLARNRGTNLATGEYVTYVDSDDTVDIDTYEIVAEQISLHSPDVVSFGMIRASNKSNQLKRTGSTGEPTSLNGDVRIVAQFLEGEKWGMSSCNKVFKKEIVDQIQFDPDLANNEDKKFVYNFFKRSNKYIQLNVNKYNYYVTPGSASSINEFRDSFFGIEDVADYVLSDVKNRYPSLVKQATRQSLNSYLGLYRALVRTPYGRSHNNDITRIRGKIIGTSRPWSGSFNSNTQIILIKYCPDLFTYIMGVYDRMKGK